MSELFEQAEKLFIENKHLKNDRIMLEQQLKGKVIFLECILHDVLPQLIISIFFFFPVFLDLEENTYIIDMKRKFEEVALKGREENIKLKDEIRGG